MHVRVQHFFVKVVVQIVVLVRHSLGESLILHIEEASFDCIDDETLIDDGLVELDGMNLCKELVQLDGIPPSVHVRLAKSQRSLGQDTTIESVIVHQDISRLGAIDLDLSLVEQLLNDLLVIHRVTCPY